MGVTRLEFRQMNVTAEARARPADSDVLVGAEDVYLGVGQHHSGLGGVLDRELGLAALCSMNLG